MTGKVFFSVTVTLDGYMAPHDRGALKAWRDGRSQDPELRRWMTQWSELQEWVFGQQFFRENLHMGEGGETGADNDLLEKTFDRTGVSIMGKRMFDAGEQGWPEEAPFHTPVFVLTHEEREPWKRPGGTTFHFVNDGIESALRQAREEAGDRDIRIAGGGDTIRQYLDAGLVDEFTISLRPVFFGSGIKLFEDVDSNCLALDLIRTVPSETVTHLTYAVRRRAESGN